MKRGVAWFLVAWMMFLTVWTVSLAIAVYDREPASVAYAKSAALDVRDPITVRWETTADDGRGEVLPPKIMPLWQYVQDGNESVEARLTEFERAFESDLENKDATFHQTHEVIDGTTW